MPKTITPPYLKKGDQIALIAPSGLIEDEQAFIKAEQWLESLGLKSVRGKNAMKKFGTYSGTDAQRLSDLQRAMNDPEIKAIWAVRGGYGAMRILSHLNFRLFTKHPKWLIGLSDITAFHNLWANYKIESIHGLMPIQFTRTPQPSDEALESLKHALFGHKVSYEIKSNELNRLGKGAGKIVGGNLSLIAGLLGTPYQLKTKGKVLFLEDVGEYSYRINRKLFSLKLAGLFDNLEGLIVGSFTDIKDSDTPFNQTINEMILEVTHDKKYPIMFDFPAGHIQDNRALILGRKVKLDVNEDICNLTFKKK